MTGVTVEPAADIQKPLIANLVQLYLYDMTADLPFPIGEDGRFEYDFLDRFWKHPYLIRFDGEIAGFALVIEECPVTGKAPYFFMTEFFVLKAYRSRGVGGKAVRQIFANHTGPWHVGVIARNSGAMAFWNACLNNQADLSSRNIRFDEEDWLLYEFST